MTSHTHYLWFQTKRRQEILDITDQVAEQVEASGVQEGFVLVSAMHITASVFVNDHESGLWQDILKWLEDTVAPWSPERYRHNETGEDNAAAHLRSLTIGHEVIVHFRCGEDMIIAKLGAQRIPRFNEQIELVMNCNAIHLFDPETEQRLPG